MKKSVFKKDRGDGKGRVLGTSNVNIDYPLLMEGRSDTE